jgi:hypothetical protein
MSYSSELSANIDMQTKLIQPEIDTYKKKDTASSPSELRTNINMQTELIVTELDTYKNVENAGIVNTRKIEYQVKTTEGLKKFNTFLLYFYYFIFIVNYIVIFVKMYFYGAKRDYRIESIIFIGFLTFPFIIYYVEVFLYEGYIMNFIKR